MKTFLDYQAVYGCNSIKFDHKGKTSHSFFSTNDLHLSVWRCWKRLLQGAWNLENYYFMKYPMKRVA